MKLCRILENKEMRTASISNIIGILAECKALELLDPGIKPSMEILKAELLILMAHDYGLDFSNASPLPVEIAAVYNALQAADFEERISSLIKAKTKSKKQ